MQSRHTIAARTGWVEALDRPGTVLLDSVSKAGDGGRSLLFTAPVAELAAHTPEEVAAVLAGVDTALEAGHHVAGYLAYEAGQAFEQVGPCRPAPLPLAWFGVYPAPVQLMAEEVAQGFGERAGEPFAVTPGAFAYAWPTYRRLHEEVRERIREGEVYQVNLTGPYRFRFEGSPRAFYAALRRRQPVRYGAWLRLREGLVLSRSPELFFERRGRKVCTRPMKGTVRRGEGPGEDAALHRWLRDDPKSRAENLMIVDLLRNDLARCCVPGSVRVPSLFATEAYPTLIQMTSTVEGTLRSGMGYADLFRALFPCGSVTGAPKVAAMRLIAALEEAPRGVYCGAIGYAAPGGEAVFSVAIRTLTLSGGEGVMGTGSGVVWDSQPADEYDECLLKTRFLTGHDG